MYFDSVIPAYGRQKIFNVLMIERNKELLEKTFARLIHAPGHISVASCALKALRCTRDTTHLP
jgi:hypothetical protein